MQDVSYHNGATPQAQPQAAFVILPAAVFLDERLSDRDVRVLGAIATQANKLRITPPIAQSWIARKVSSQRPKVNESITSLVEKRYLEVFHHGSAKGGRAANTYRVLFDTRGNPIPPTNGGESLAAEDSDTSCVTHMEHNYDEDSYIPAARHNTPVKSLHSDTTTINTSRLSNPRETQLDKSPERDTTTPELSNPTGTTNTGSQNRRDTGSQIQSSEADQDLDLRVPRQKESSPLDEVNFAQNERASLWREVTAKLPVTDGQRQSWLLPCHLYEFDGDFVLAAPTQMVYTSVRQRWEDAIKVELRTLARSRGIPFQSFEVIGVAAQTKRKQHSETPPASYSHAM